MKRLTIKVSDECYAELNRRAGSGDIGRIVETLTAASYRPVTLEGQYRDAAEDKEAERLAREWLESGVGETLPADDWSWLRDEERRGLVGELRSGDRGRDPQDPSWGDRLER